ncbi:MAG: ATP/GTP-binding protein [Candidatus Odinarchaeota archaeon]
MSPNIAFIMGTAGSGKTVLTAVLKKVLDKRGVDVVCVNLDPAVKDIPYPADVDVREWVSIDDLIEEYSLGPNGAIVASADLVASHVHEIKEEINDLGADAVLVDTPGQLEVFVYRSSGPLIVNYFKDELTAGLFLFDSSLMVDRAVNYVSLSLLAFSTIFRVNLPLINVLTKVDLIGDDQLEKITRWSESTEGLMDDVPPGPISDYALTMTETLRSFETTFPLIPASALKEDGIIEIVAELSRIWQRGDDWL